MGKKDSSNSTSHVSNVGEQREQWDARYESGNMPWDSGVTPPEVVVFLTGGHVAAKGTALDLGCGAGTNVAWLARRGLDVIGVEHAGNALDLARERLRDIDPSVQRRIALVQGDVAHLPLTALNAAYILDIGCLHGVLPGSRPSYARGVIDNLGTDGYYHLFAFDRPDEPAPDSPMPWRGLGVDEVETLFTPALEVAAIVRGDPDHYPCRWYLLHKPG